jgi:hypothetical protein
VFPNYIQKRAVFSLEDLNCLLPAREIKSTNSVGPGNVQVMPSAAVQVSNLEMDTVRVPWSPISNLVFSPTAKYNT